MSWLDRVEAAGRNKVKAKEAAKPTPFWSPDEESGDPGHITEGFFTLSDGVVTLVDRDGYRLDECETATASDPAHAAAARLLRDRRAGDTDDFDRRQRYGRGPVY